MAEHSAAMETPETKVPVKRVAPLHGILMELDQLVKDRRKHLRSLLEKRLKITTDPASRRIFLQHGLAGAPIQIARAMAAAAGAKPAAAEAAVEDLLAFYAGKQVQAADGAEALIPKAPVVVVVVTWMSEEAALGLLESLGLAKDNVRIFSASPGDPLFPDSNIWLDAMRSVGGSARRCLAVVDHEAACRAALSTGLRCVAVPEDLTSYQDFGGAFRILDSLTELPAVWAEFDE
ncbi:MAG: hypothetical protein U1E27_09450 [Kiritimatiellia bacterium]|nr:hypothetical protein [Kiritimatiellia bacterium]